MVSLLVRLAATGFLLATAILILDVRECCPTGSYPSIRNFGIYAVIAMMAGVGGMIWLTGTKAMSFLLRSVASVPVLSGIIVVMIWMDPPWVGTKLDLFAGSVIVALAALFVALWAYWPERK